MVFPVIVMILTGIIYLIVVTNIRKAHEQHLFCEQLKYGMTQAEIMDVLSEYGDKIELISKSLDNGKILKISSNNKYILPTEKTYYLKFQDQKLYAVGYFIPSNSDGLITVCPVK